MHFLVSSTLKVPCVNPKYFTSKAMSERKKKKSIKAMKKGLLEMTKINHSESTSRWTSIRTAQMIRFCDHFSVRFAHFSAFFFLLLLLLPSLLDD